MLPAYVNLYRDEPVPEDYRLGRLAYDWTLNSQDHDRSSAFRRTER